ncbi:MAG: alpha/beta fold hydrolase [Chloroflexota bacterium]
MPPLSPIPFTAFSNHGPPLFFLHANGYPPACYKPFLRQFTDYHVRAMHLRPLWPGQSPDGLRDWKPLTDDFLRFLDEQNAGRVLAVGHSLGAITILRAALKNPERFRAIVLIDPVLFPPRRIIAWNIVRALGLGYKTHPLIRGTLKRRPQFDDMDQVFRAYRQREVFRFFSDESLRAYIEGILRPRADGGREASPIGGYELAYSPEWEARIYYTGIWRDLELWRGLRSLRVPTLFVRGAETDTFWASAADLVKRKQPAVRVETVERSTHLLPLERPEEVAKIVLSFLKEIP